MKKLLSLVLCAVLLFALLPVLTRTVSAQSVSNFNIRLDTPVASYTPDFSPKFNTDATVYSTVTWKENSPGFSAKLGNNDEFRAGLSYKVEIWVRFGEGSYLATDNYGDLAAALTVNNQAISSLKINERDSQNRIIDVTITCEYGPLSGMEVSKAQVTGIPTPVAGDMPIFSFSLGSNNAYYFYHTEPIVWWDKTTGEQLGSGDLFVQGHQYQVNIWLAANREQGYTFRQNSKGEPDVNVTINSWAADTVRTAYEQDPREVIDIRYTFPTCQAAHTCAPKLVPQQEPTCLLYGFKAYYECSCGKCFEDAAGKKQITDMDGYGILPALGHVEGSWSHDGTHHYKICTRCREVIPGTEADHKWSPTYLYMDAKGHAWICADCKERSQVEAHTPGPEATDTEPQTCTDCGYIIKPAKQHTHVLTQMPEVAPTCIASGTVAHYACSGCTALFSDAEGKKPLPADTNVVIPPLGHATSDNWSFDTQYHWRSCTRCKQVLEETKMLHEGSPCSSCGYVEGQPITEPVIETDGATNAPKREGKETDLTVVWIVLIALLGTAVGAGATVLVLKKKKG